MARFCFVLWGGGGNVTATMPIVTRLLERGHEVDVLGDATLAEGLDPSIDFTAFRRVPLNDGRDPATDAIRDWQGRTPFGGMWRGYRWLFGGALRVAEDLVDHLRAQPADVVVVDTMLPGGLMGAEVVGARSASLVHTAWYLPVAGAVPMAIPLRPARSRLGRIGMRAASEAYRRIFNGSTRPLNGQRKRVGLPPVRTALEQFCNADRLLVLTSPSFDFVPHGLPDHAVYIGAPMPQPEPDRWRPPPGTEPLVLVALSTTFQDQAALLERIASVLGELPVRGLITSGAIDAASLRVPPNVSVVGHVPHVDVMPHASAVVTHAGHGTTIASMAHGVPVLCLPHGRDQPGVAARAVAAGAGIRLSKNASADKLTAALRRLLDDPSYTAAARRLAASIAAEGNAADRGADELEALL